MWAFLAGVVVGGLLVVCLLVWVLLRVAAEIDARREKPIEPAPGKGLNELQKSIQETVERALRENRTDRTVN